MKRKIFLYGLLLFIIVGGIPYFTGMLVENQFNQLTEALADNPNITLKNISYERHWRHSIAKTRVTLEGGLLKKILQELGEELNDTDENLNKPITILLEHEIRHGPFVQLEAGNYRDWEFAQAYIYSKLSLSDEAKAVLEKEVGQVDFITFQSVVSIDGEISIQLKGKPIKVKEGDLEDVVWQGMQGTWQISSDLQKVTGEMKMPGFHFDVDGANYQAKNLLFKTESEHQIEEKIWLSKGKLTTENLIIKQAGMPNIVLENMVMVANVAPSAQSSHKLQSVMQCKVHTIKVDDKIYGPLTYTFKTENLTVDAFKSLMFMRNEMGLRVNKYTQNFNQWQNQLAQVLQSRPIFNLENLQLKTQQGIVEGQMQFAIGGPKAQDLRRIDLLIGSIAAKAKISMPKLFLEEILASYYQTAIQTAELGQGETRTKEALQADIKNQVDVTLSNWITKNYILPKNDNYLIILGFDEGKLHFNDSQMALPTFPKQ